MIISCVCFNTFQDARYGSHRRVANFAHKAHNMSGGDGGWRCTNCERVHAATQDDRAMYGPRKSGASRVTSSKITPRFRSRRS